MEDDFLRYSCQMVLPGFDKKAQQSLQNARVLVVGVGGLGCPCAQYLASSGVGHLGIADFDIISIGNLHRQILFNQDETGKKKSIIAALKLRKQNPFIEVIDLDIKITSENVMDVIGNYDIIVDGTDNFETKYLLNDACVLSGKPLVHGAIYQYEGQIAVWNVDNKDGTYSPNLRDIFPEVDASKIPNCAEGGVVPTLAGIIGCMQANEVIKYLTGSKELLTGKLLLFDAQSLRTTTINIGTKSQVEIKDIAKTVHIPQITVSELSSKLKENNIDLIDVRTVKEREEFNIGGRHLPVENFDYENLMFSESDETIIYCASGKRSGEVVKKLKHLYPMNKIFSLEGGMKTWKEAVSKTQG